jgi:hypothetical protein
LAVPTADCSENYFCLPGSEDEFGKQNGIVTNLCEAGSFCPSGTPSQIKCKAGFYNSGTENGCAQCPENFYCQYSGTTEPEACEPGYTCPNKDSDFTLYNDFADAYKSWG